MQNTTRTNESTQDIKRLIILWSIRLLIILSIFLEIQFGRWQIFYVNLFALLLSFLPSAIKRILSISLPLGFEVLFLLSLLLSVVLEKILGGILVQIVLGMFLGIIGFILMFVLYSNARIKTSYFFVALFSFSFSVSMGAIWEVFRFLMVELFNLRFGEIDLQYAPWGLLLTMVGAAIVSIIGYLYIRTGTEGFLHQLMMTVVRKNPRLFTDYERSPEFVRDLIKQGESETVEFKSTLKINLHTKQVDKKMEYEVMKTIVSFLNASGGTLLVGVSDTGEIIGIEQDSFPTNDLYYRHFTNLVKKYIGNEYLPFINSALIPLDDLHVLKIDCSTSSKAVFLQLDNAEEFYVRTGPTSRKLEGSKLLTYVRQRFKTG